MSSGCKKHLETDITVHQLYTKCPRPEAPAYESFLDEYITSPTNYEILMRNIVNMKNYNVDLERTVECYELQAK